MAKLEYADAVSCKELFIENSKPINGYSQMNSMVRALGFDSNYDIQCSLNNGFRHLINAGDVESVAKWFFKNGYDIVKLKK